VIRNTLFVFFLALGIPDPASAGLFSKGYSAEPIEAWVIDAETKQPLEGVIVTANWQLEEGTFGGNVPVGQLMVMEAVTDNNGRFYFPAWGPIKPKKGHLVIRDPQLLIFKSGYKHFGLENELAQNYNKGPVRRSEWNGKKIEMREFKGGLKEYGKHLVDLNISLNWAINGRNCEWKSITRMILALGEVDRQLRKIGVERSVSQIHSLIPFEGKEDKCGARIFFKDWNG